MWMLKQAPYVSGDCCNGGHHGPADPFIDLPWPTCKDLYSDQPCGPDDNSNGEEPWQITGVSLAGLNVLSKSVYLNDANCIIEVYWFA